MASIDQHAAQLGRLAAKVMLDRLETAGGREGPAVVEKLEPVPKVRSSTTPAGA